MWAVLALDFPIPLRGRTDYVLCGILSGLGHALACRWVPVFHLQRSNSVALLSCAAGSIAGGCYVDVPRMVALSRKCRGT